ncbi:MAG: PaaI family thioesterase [Candidatus Desulforudis sp.]|nr:PaaI family thioesterase [Desulforudis sp.]
MCFACSPDNPIGLKLVFEDDGVVCRTRFTPGLVHQGWNGRIHGGILSTLLDEAMAQLLYRRRETAVTAELTVRFKRSAPVGRELLVEARQAAARGRLVEVKAQARFTDGTVVATAGAKFLKVRDI